MARDLEGLTNATLRTEPSLPKRRSRLKEAREQEDPLEEMGVLPTGGHLEQADGTAWMALFSQNMLELAVKLAAQDPSYEEMVFKFMEHFYFIASAMNRPGPDSMWDEEDRFYYDLLRLPDGTATRARCPLHGGSPAPLRVHGD